MREREKERGKIKKPNLLKNRQKLKKQVTTNTHQFVSERTRTFFFI